MATTVFEQEKSVFFVINQDGSTAEAGGCTQDWWDTECPNGTEAEAAAAMAKLFNGSAPLIEEEGAVYTGQDNRIAVSGAGAAGVEIGMVAYVIESGTPDTNVETGRYKITAAGANYIECNGIEGQSSDDDTYVDVVIGGAFEYLQDALDETDAAYHSVTIHVRSNDIVETAIDADGGGGNNTRNTFKRIAGFNTAPGDMNRGGTYYQSPLEILQAGSIDNTKTVLLDGDGVGGYSILNIAEDNIIFENFHLTGTGGENAILFTGTPQNIVFRNCRFSEAAFVFASTADSVLVDSCFAMNLSGNHYMLYGNNNVILNCVSEVASGKIFAVAATVEGSQVAGCIAVGGARGIRVFGNDIAAMNNTFYNQTVYGVDLNNATRAIVFNNIFDLAPGAIGLSITAAGSFIYNDYNCFIESDGTPLTVGGHESGYEVPDKGKHSVEADPDFADAANGDFRVRNPAVLLGGKCGPDGNAAVIGAIGQEYQFAARARVMNPGRMGIVR